MEESSCPKCGASAPAGEKFCAACGYALQASRAEQQQVGHRIGLKYAKQSYQGKMRSGRTTILVCAVLFTLGTAVIYVISQAQIDKADKEIRGAKGNPLYDQEKVLEGEKKLESARGMVTLIVAGNGVLALTFYGMWFWAKHRPLPATLCSLILYIAVQALNAALDPASLAQGILIKILILVALIGSVNGAVKFQKLQQQGI